MIYLPKKIRRDPQEVARTSLCASCATAAPFAMLRPWPFWTFWKTKKWRHVGFQRSGHGGFLIWKGYPGYPKLIIHLMFGCSMKKTSNFKKPRYGKIVEPLHISSNDIDVSKCSESKIFLRRVTWLNVTNWAFKSDSEKWKFGPFQNFSTGIQLPWNFPWNIMEL